MFRGIVLQIESFRRVTIFDEEYGKRELRLPFRAHKNLVHGSVILYTFLVDKNICVLSYADMIQVPLIFARHHIAFFQEALDICLMCSSYGIAVPDAFYLLSYLFAYSEKQISVKLKKLILLKLLWLFDVYVEEMLQHLPMMNYLHSHSIEDILKENYSIEDVTLQKWLYACLERSFKNKTLLHGNKND